MADFPIQEGEVPFVIPGIDRVCKTYYKIVGDIPTSGSGKPLLVVLHGGPGAGHDYLLGLADLASKYSTPVIFYDQIGNCLSTHLPETAGDESFWTEPLFIRELDNLLDHLKLRDTGYHIFGQNVGLWKQSIKKLRSELPEDIQKVINDAEGKGDFESPEYEEAVGVFYKKHLCLARPWPAPEVAAAIRWLTENTTVYGTMNGPSELTLTGSLTGWTVIDRLKDIKAPTLVYNGDVDEAQDLCVVPSFENIPRVRWITLRDSSHFTHVDHRDAVVKLIGDFLTRES